MGIKVKGREILVYKRFRAGLYHPKWEGSRHARESSFYPGKFVLRDFRKRSQLTVTES